MADTKLDNYYRPVVEVGVLIPTSVTSGTGDVQVIAATPGLTLYGFSLTESAASAAAAEVSVRHGTAATDPELFGVTLGADQSTSDMWQKGVSIPNGLFLDRITGTTKFTAFTRIEG